VDNNRQQLTVDNNRQNHPVGTPSISSGDTHTSVDNNRQHLLVDKPREHLNLGVTISPSSGIGFRADNPSGGEPVEGSVKTIDVQADPGENNHLDNNNVNRLSPQSITQLSYFDECSTTSLQFYNGFIHVKANNLTELTEEWLLQQMELEWKEESLLPHWEYVTHPVPSSTTTSKDKGHEDWTVQNFLKQPEAVAANLTASEVLAIRLYTGDGYKPLNESCRAANGRFAVTVFIANRGIAKLGRAHSHSIPQVYYRGLKGQLRYGFCEAYQTGQGLVECFSLSDGGLFSTTSDISVASKGAFSGNLLFVISNNQTKRDETVEEGEGYEYLYDPAPISFLSQYPNESEYLWPTYTSFIPLLPSQRLGTYIDDKEIYEFSARYRWDTHDQCVGRWRDIEESELQMHHICIKLASLGLGMRDAAMVPMLLADSEVDEDLTVEQAVSIAFSVLDRETKGVIEVKEVVRYLRWYYLEISRKERTMEEVESTLQRVDTELLKEVAKEDSLIYYGDWKKHYAEKEYTKF
jgi:hypothetical protein